MKAVIRYKYGFTEVLEIQEVQKPIPKDNEILVRVYATTVNRTDCGILTGKPFIIRFFTGLFKPKSSFIGTDFAGKIEAIGKNVSSFKVGDKVWGFNDEGLNSQGEYMVIFDDQALSKIPDNFSYEEAAACAEGAHYAYNFTKKFKINSDTKILLNGATGAIGTAAIQILTHFGAQVTAVGNTKNLSLLKQLGADKIYDYMTQDFTKDTNKYHFVLDTVGNSSFSKCKHLLHSKGVYLSSEFGPKYENIYLPLITKLLGGKRVIFPIPSDCKASIQFINSLMECKKFLAVIDKTYPMDQIKDAYKYVASGKKTGNVIIQY